ncbi:hypothetical protein F6X54_01415 [Micromonospora aurantiaca]|uniref:ApeA N-terminal domain-containing protein n=1 Tax=Micromonospora aurantiaca (nom. illeg.) TaxID=47850 RepID=A0ABQ6UP54_9ACTN|nr:HEPN domain-containing protein [Micromonospora aurantiaca]KAB1118863.1 hypothetical protein F6X54_01415 [Micromonospora aurantiaca]
MFWLAANPDIQVPGELDLSGDRPRVKLGGSLTSPWVMEHKQNPDGSVVTVGELRGDPEDRNELVYGEVEKAGKVTLIDAFTVSQTLGFGPPHVGPGYGLQEMSARYAVLGGHISGPDHQFNEMRVRFPGAEEWFALPGVVWGMDREVDKVQAAVSRANPDSASLTHRRGNIHVDETLTITDRNLSGVRVGRRIYFWLTDLDGVTIDELGRAFAGPLRSLMRICTTTAVEISEVMVRVGPDERWLHVHSTYTSPESDSRPTQRKILVTFQSLGTQGVATWLERADQLGALVHIVGDIFAGSKATIETQLLQLAAAAEGIHRRLYDDTPRLNSTEVDLARTTVKEAIRDLPAHIREAIKQNTAHISDPTFAQRLVRLSDEARRLLPEVTGTHPAIWARYVKNVRNSYAHQLTDEDRRPTLDEQVVLWLSLKWLLVTLLLASVGVQKEIIDKRIGDSENYQRFLAQATAWFPAAYGRTQEDDT